MSHEDRFNAFEWKEILSITIKGRLENDEIQTVTSIKVDKDWAADQQKNNIMGENLLRCVGDLLSEADLVRALLSLTESKLQQIQTNTKEQRKVYFWPSAGEEGQC